MSIDAYDGRIEAFYPQTHRVRPHKGQVSTADGQGGNLLALHGKAHKVVVFRSTEDALHRQAVAFPIDYFGTAGTPKELEGSHGLAALGGEESIARAEKSAILVKSEDVEHSLVGIFRRERARKGCGGNEQGEYEGGEGFHKL